MFRNTNLTQPHVPSIRQSYSNSLTRLVRALRLRARHATSTEGSGVLRTLLVTRRCQLLKGLVTTNNCSGTFRRTIVTQILPVILNRSFVAMVMAIGALRPASASLVLHQSSSMSRV